MANIDWELIGKKTLQVVNGDTEKTPEARFKFTLTRYKDENTKRERLAIECKLDDKDNGMVETTVDNLDKAFDELMQYGVVFSNDNERIKIKRKIKEVYLNVDSVKEPTSVETRLSGFLAAVGEYIQLSEADNTGEQCFLLVSDFDDIAMDCGYKSYEMQALRQELKKADYIRTLNERYTVLVRYRGKPTRVIAFLRDKMESEGHVDHQYFVDAQSKKSKAKSTDDTSSKEQHA